jgi:hypothetical protein
LKRYRAAQVVFSGMPQRAPSQIRVGGGAPTEIRLKLLQI